MARTPGPVLSEVLRSMDPLGERGQALDVAHGLTVQQGHAHHSDVGKLMDRYGRRLHHVRVMQGAVAIMHGRGDEAVASGDTLPRLLPADFDVLQRCMGAAGSVRGAVAVFGEMHSHALAHQRTTGTWTEFLRARYLLDPAYYQYDRARFVLDPRNAMSKLDIWMNVPPGRQYPEIKAENAYVMPRLDAIRMGANAFLREPWGREPDDADDKPRRMLRSKRTSGPPDIQIAESFWSHLGRQQAFPNTPTEDLMCADMVGLARSGDRWAILNRILDDHYGITVSGPHPDTGTFSVSGGRDFLPDSPLRPTTRLMTGIVDALCSMSELSLAMQLVDFVSRRYDLPIPRSVWSNLLSWSYVCSSKKLRRMRRILAEAPYSPQNSGQPAEGQFSTSECDLDANDVLHIWSVMTAPPYSVEPSFEDVDICIRSLIVSGRARRAIELIRGSAMPYHDRLTRDYETALFDEILLKDATASSQSRSDKDARASAAAVSRATHHRRHLETLSDHVAVRLASVFDALLRATSRVRTLRSNAVTTRLIPDLVRDYPHLFYRGVRYRTATGRVLIRDPDEAAAHARWATSNAPVARNILPQKLSRYLVRNDELDEHGNTWRVPAVDGEGPGTLNPRFRFPRTHPSLVVERRRIPRQRQDVPPPPRDGGLAARENWLGSVKEQLMM